MNYTITDDKLTYKIDTTEPIEVNDLINSLKNISNEYGCFSKIKDVEVKVSEVRKGSYIFDLMLSTTIPLLPIIEHTSTTIDFIKKLYELKKIFLDNKIDHTSDNKPSIGEANMINSLSKHSQNVYNGCTIYISDNTEQMKMDITKEESKELLTNSSNYLKLIKQIEKDEKETILNDRVIKFVQRRFDNNDKGNKSICENIANKEITTIFNDDILRNDILNNATDYLFVVDLEIQYSDNKPVLYKVLKLNDKIEIDKE